METPSPQDTTVAGDFVLSDRISYQELYSIPAIALQKDFFIDKVSSSLTYYFLLYTLGDRQAIVR
jgi:hypothetical protein